MATTKKVVKKAAPKRVVKKKAVYKTATIHNVFGWDARLNSNGILSFGCGAVKLPISSIVALGKKIEKAAELQKSLMEGESAIAAKTARDRNWNIPTMINSLNSFKKLEKYNKTVKV